MEQRRKGDDGRIQSEVVSEGNWETERRTPEDFMGDVLLQQQLLLCFLKVLV